MGKHVTMKMWEDAGAFGRIAKAGDTVDEEIAMQFLNCAPPFIFGRDEDGISFFQSSEPYSHEKTDSGKFYAPTYSTFERKNGMWYYHGNCFRGERKDRTPTKKKDEPRYG